jgi:hypothetical protein
MMEQPPPPPPELAGGVGSGFAEPVIVATAAVPPPDRLSEAVPLYAPAAAGETVTVTAHEAPDAIVALLHASADAVMMAGLENMIAPAFIAKAFGLLKLRFTVVDCPTVTVVAVLLGVEVANPVVPAEPVKLTSVEVAAPLTGTVNVATCAPVAVGV